MNYFPEDYREELILLTSGMVGVKKASFLSKSGDHLSMTDSFCLNFDDLSEILCFSNGNRNEEYL